MMKAVFLLGLVVLQLAEAAFVWQQLIPSSAATPGPRSSGALGFFPQSQVLVAFGGTKPGEGSQNDVWLFFLQNRTWVQANPPGPLPRGRNTPAYGSYTADGQELLIIAHGTVAGSNVLGDIWAYNVTANTWRELPNVGDVPAARYAPAFGIFPGSSLFMMSHGFAKHRFSNTFSYDLRASAWIELYGGTNPYNPKAPHARCLVASAIVSPTRLAMYGGCMQVGFTGGPCPARDGWALDWSLNSASTPMGFVTQEASSPSWRRMDDGPSPRARGSLARVPRSWALPTTAKDLVLLLGGEEKGKQTISVDRASDFDVDVLDTSTGAWYQAIAQPAQAGGALPTFRASAAVATDDVGGRVFMWGGALQRAGGGNVGELWMLTYNATSEAAAATPAMSPRRHASYWFIYPHLHGIFMGLSWGILLPAGVLMARHLRHKDPLWFQLHRAVQATGVLFSIVGLAVVVAGGAYNPAFAHGIIGLIVILLGILQPINAYFRPHQGMRWRHAWELLHKCSGRLAVLLGLVNVSLGTFLVVGPTGLIIAWHVILGCMVLLAVGLEAWLVWQRRNGLYGKAAAAEDLPPGLLEEHHESGGGANPLPYGASQNSVAAMEVVLASKMASSSGKQMV